MINIVCSGFGGQGVLTMGLIFAKTGMDMGKNVIWMPAYGSEMRGGTANCNVKISDDEIASPFMNEIDIVMALNTPSVDKFQNKLTSGGYLIVNSSMIPIMKFREDINVYTIGAGEIAGKLENSRGTNIVMIGTMVKATQMISKEEMEKGIKNYFLEKGKGSPKNQECFQAGYTNCEKIQEAKVVKTVES